MADMENASEGVAGPRKSNMNLPISKRATQSCPGEVTAGTMCVILLLPSELRNSIYKEVLTSPRAVEIRLSRPILVPESLRVTQPAITRTCHQIREENLSLYYQLNTFDIKAPVGVEMIPRLLTCHIDKIRLFKIDLNHAFFNLDLSQDSLEKKFVTAVGTYGMHDALHRTGLQYLESELGEGEELNKMSPELLKGLIQALRNRMIGVRGIRSSSALHTNPTNIRNILLRIDEGEMPTLSPLKGTLAESSVQHSQIHVLGHIAGPLY